MFGDSAKGRSAAIDDSRELGDLASVVADPIKLEHLMAGKSLSEIMRITQPIENRLGEGLYQVKEILRDLISSISEREVSRKVAASVVPTAESNRRLAEDIEDRLRKAAKS